MTKKIALVCGGALVALLLALPTAASAAPTGNGGLADSLLGGNGLAGGLVSSLLEPGGLVDGLL